MTYDTCVIGGGIVGLATAMKVLELRPGSSLVLIEKETRLGQHQTGHNSGVIHAGIYYKPGSLRAKLCREGAQATKAFCLEHGIPIRVCGKLIVATNPIELERMQALAERARLNQIEIERLDALELQRAEPNVAGLGALLVPASGIVDFLQVAATMGQIIQKRGGEIALGDKITGIKEGLAQVDVFAGQKNWAAKRLIVCSGLHSDRLALLAGLKIEHRVIPFRGDYYRLPEEKKDIVRHLVYPVPDPSLPFLGIHLTPIISGGMTVGPNAIVGLAREGYGKFSVHLRDLAEYAFFPGFWRILRRHRRAAWSELVHSLWKPAYLRECQKYCPSLRVEDLLPYRSGVRAQAVGRDGMQIDDFLFIETARMLHVCNAPSPAATSAIPIGETIARKCFPRP